MTPISLYGLNIWLNAVARHNIDLTLDQRQLQMDEKNNLFNLRFNGN